MASKKRSGRGLRAAGVFLAVIVLAAGGSLALVLSSRTGTSTSGAPGTAAGGAQAATVDAAAAWVAGQVSRSATVACDPAMCRALESHGIAAGSLSVIGQGTTRPFHAQVIVATAAVRTRFGNLLGAAYAPAVLASFGTGPRRIDIRQTAPRGAAVYRAMLGADLATRKAVGGELLHSNRILVTALARGQLIAGQVDSRLLIAIASLASVHSMYIIDFGNVAPGGDPALPLRYADLAEMGRPHHHVSSRASAVYVRSVAAFLHAQRAPFRPAHMRTMVLAGGEAVLRIGFSAPSPLGLLGPRRG